MNEVIESVLNDETLTTNEERAEALRKGLATLVIPKDKYNDLSRKLKTTETDLLNTQSEFDDFKKSKMTDDEKIQEREKEYARKVSENNLRASELAVKSLLLDNGIKVTDEDTELKETLENIISEDKDKSIKLANSFISLLNKTKVETENATTTKLLNDTPKPIGGVESSSNLTQVDKLKNELKEAIENKDVVRQTQLTTQIFIEEQKLKSKNI